MPPAPSAPLLERSYPLPGGRRVRLRLARMRDAVALEELLGGKRGGLAATRLARFDPRRSVVVCAGALIASVETLVGVGAIELHASTPHLVAYDESRLNPEEGEALTGLLERALCARQRAFAARHAA